MKKSNQGVLRSRKTSSPILFTLLGLMKERGLSWVIPHVIGSVLRLNYRKKQKQKISVVPTMSLSEFEEFLIGIGVGKGSAIFLHSSWDSLGKPTYTPLDLINVLSKLVGSGGTLAMPAYSGQALVNGAKFDVDNSLSRAGWLTEVFRRVEGVVRSSNIAHSVCASGAKAAFLTKDHHKGNSPWDEFSPYFRIGAIPDSWIVGLGVGHDLRIATSLHCVESLLINHPYFRRLFQREISYEFSSRTYGSGRAQTKVSSSVIAPEKISGYFDQKVIEKTIGGVEVYAIRAVDLIEGSLELGLKGKTMYVWPIPWFWYFFSSRNLTAKNLLSDIFSRLDKQRNIN